MKKDEKPSPVLVGIAGATALGLLWGLLEYVNTKTKAK